MKFTLYLTLCLVVLVIFLFLRNISATIIPSLALPMSLLATFAVMKVLGYSLDNLSLMALTLSVGFVVDDAIVMLENIVRHMEMGEKPMQAALDGSREIGFTILSMTLSLVAVFIPVLFLGGIVGRLFREFAVTIAVSILVSAFVSLTLTPMLCSRFLKPAARGPAPSRVEQATAWFERGYESIARRCTSARWRGSWSRRPATVVFSVLVLVGTVVLWQLVPEGVHPERGPGPAARHHRGGGGHVLRRDDAVPAGGDGDPAGRLERGGFMSAVGWRPRHRPATRAGSSSGSSRARERTLDADARRAGAARASSRRCPGIRVYFTNPPPINIGGRSVEEPVPVHPAGHRHRPALRQRRRSWRRRCAALPQLRDVTSDLQIRNPQIRVAIDRDRASSLGVTAQQIEQALYNAYGAGAGLHHLHRQQPVLGGDRAAAAVPARPRRAAPALGAGAQRHAGAAHRAGDGHRDGGPARR